MPKPRKAPEAPTLVLITWHDAVADSGWTSAAKISPDRPVIRSVGWLIHRSRKHYILAADFGVGTDDETNRRLEIPRGCALKVTPLAEVPGEGS